MLVPPPKNVFDPAHGIGVRRDPPEAANLDKKRQPTGAKGDTPWHA